jgi:signal transduction histidine kinase
MAARAAAEQALLQSQKLEVVGRLTGGIAHDFNNLLTVILVGTELAQRDGSPEVRDAAESAYEAATQAAHLTRQLLSFSRKAVVLPQVIDLGLTVTRAQKVLQRVLPRGVHLEVSAASGAWTRPRGRASSSRSSRRSLRDKARASACRRWPPSSSSGEAPWGW